MRFRPAAIALLFLSLWSAGGICDRLDAQRLEAGWRAAPALLGELVELDADGDAFVALLRRQQAGEPLGAVVLLHGRATHANSAEVLRPLRLGLAEAGWETLAVQLPSAYRDEDADDWRSRAPVIVARLRAAFTWLKGQQQLNQVVIALGESGPPVLAALAAAPPAELQALVLVSSGDDMSDPAARAGLDGLTLPLLDVYAERDLADVTEGARQRRRVMAELGATRFAQREVAGATPGFHGLDDSLLATIRAWLAANAAGGRRDARR